MKIKPKKPIVVIKKRDSVFKQVEVKIEKSKGLEKHPMVIF